MLSTRERKHKDRNEKRSSRREGDCQGHLLQPAKLKYPFPALQQQKQENM
jgi:hypothetical protein